MRFCRHRAARSVNCVAAFPLCSTGPEDLQLSRRLEANDDVALATERVDKLIVSSAELIGDDPASPDAGRTLVRVLQELSKPAAGWLAVGLGSAVKAPSEAASPAWSGRVVGLGNKYAMARAS
ncbi:hypothetical protein DHEL01_v211023 [Diaporthe helianthi]|uniref:Uncharacterized protein n=1 Tax=Diaporthe helianthi TaxID=158607 RepID=A0A2P5HK32_DIAHE|nr:hypothetical protein DHEL01_v211023 [Diaporthe helianthi]